ncbi:MAG: alanine racemase [Burkholderiaceae bacterium]|nr:alanine racemase [Burkholderiaceae bacterium]
MSRPTLATIRIDAMAHNLERARGLAAGSTVWAVVKADAYGHGLANAVKGFDRADGLALVEFEGAQRLRALGWTRPILMLEGAFDQGDVELAARLDLGLVVHCAEQRAWAEAFAGERRLDLFLKFNSGMNRLGFDETGLRAAHASLRAARATRSLALVTHFANADLSGGADDALERFERAGAGLQGARSVCNSAALIAIPAARELGARGGSVRPGIMLYGATPFADRDAASLGLRPAMVLESRLIAVQQLQAGDAVGYGATFVAGRSMRVGVVACGYADGYPRHAASGAPIAVEGVRTRTVGRVAMDMLTVDLDPVACATVGSRVELWGETIPIDEIAGHAGTIGYELMCALAPRVARAVR